MSDGPKGMTPDQVAFLESRRVGRLATVDEAGRPHALPICFAHLDGVLYTPIDEKPKRGDPTTLRRVRNILANPEACLVVDHYEEDWSRLRWLQVRGGAELVDDADERARALAALRERSPQFRTMVLDSRPLIRIVPRQVVGWSAPPTARTES